MTRQDVLSDRQFPIWLKAVASGGVVSLAFVVGLARPVIWMPAAEGWLLAVLNSLAIRMINRRAVGVRSRAFVGWGIVTNAIRLLTLAGVCVLVIFSRREESGAFLIPFFIMFFVLSGIEVAGLINVQHGYGVDSGRGNGN